MSGCGKPKLVPCYEMKLGNAGGHSHQCPPQKCRPEKCNDSKHYDQMERETQEEMENAKRMLKNTEEVVRESRNISRSCADHGQDRRPTKVRCNVPMTPCKMDDGFGNREALKRLSKVAGGKGYECEERVAPRSREPTITKLSPQCQAHYTQDGGKGNDLPKKPPLTIDEIAKMLEQESKDVESARILALEVRDSYKKPCPKQQKARDAVRALLEPKKEEPPPCPPLPMKESIPSIEPEPDDISPEVAANMMYAQERGVRMISSPEFTVKHLFPDLFLSEPKDEGKKALEKEEGAEGEEEGEEGEEAEGSNAEEGEVDAEGKKGEFILKERTSKCVNRMHLRGNYAPWFPGYYAAFPTQVGETGGIQLVKSPSGIFQRAWNAANPSSVPQTDLYLLE